MRLGFISDLHLAPGALNRCTSSPGALLQWLEQLEQTVDKVVIVGDAFDLLRPSRPRGWRQQLDALEQEHPALMARLFEHELIFGNHDEPLKVLGVPEERYYSHGQRSLVATHGHQNDPWIKRLPGVAEVANFGAGWMMRAGVPGLAQALGDVPSALDRAQWRASLRRRLTDPAASLAGPDRHISYARALMQQERVSIVVMGHSHELRLVALERGLFVNTGAHAMGHQDVAIVDLEQGLVECIRDGQPLLRAQQAQDGRWQLHSP